MKLLIFCYEFPPLGGGAGNALYYLSREWSRSGFEVTVVTSAGKGFPPGQVYQEGIKIIRVGVGRKYVFRARVREMVRYMLCTSRMAGALYRSERPDLCVAFMTIPGGLGPYRMYRRYGVPYITYLRGGDVPGFGRAFLRWLHVFTRRLIYRIWKESRAVIANSEGLAALARLKVPGFDVKVIPNGVDTSAFFPKPNKQPGKNLELVFVGRFVDSQKNISMLFQILHEVEGVNLTLVGEGLDRKKFHKLLSDKKIESSVRFTGWLKEKDLLEVYQNADIYVSASLWEGMSNTALEAMACGLPLVLSDISGHRELVSQGRNGYLFDPEDPLELKKIILRLRDSVSERQAMGRSSREKAVAEHDWRQIAERHYPYFGVPKKEEGKINIANRFLAGLKNRTDRLGQNLRQNVWTHLLFLGVVLVTAFGMFGKSLGVDQITYVVYAKQALGLIREHTRWHPNNTFPYLLAGAYKLNRDFFSSLIWIYIGTAFIYLYAMRWCLRYFFRNAKVVTWLSVISIIPHYTLGMTYWGFAGFEYVKARILFMPLAPVVLRLFFEWKNNRRVWIPLVLCAAGGLLSFEAFYLLGILILFAFVFWCRRSEEFCVYSKQYIFGIFGCLVLATVIKQYYIWANLLFGKLPEVLYAAQEKIISANRTALLALSHADYIRYYWKAATAGFWWTMFPPSVSDVGFAFFNAFFLLCFGACGAWIQRRENSRLFSANALMIGCVFCIAYGHQIVRFLGGQFFLLPPYNIEEVRVCKFAFFPLFLFIGTYLEFLFRNRKTGWIVLSVVLMLLDPLEAVRALPFSAKQAIGTAAAGVLKDPKYKDYLMTAFGTGDRQGAKELEPISDILRQSYRRPEERPFVLSDRHELCGSGANIVISYHHKRLCKIDAAGGTYDLLVYWYAAYQEVSAALQSRDSGKILAAARKYGCDYAVTDFPLKNTRFKPVYEGKAYALYKIA